MRPGRTLPEVVIRKAVGKEATICSTCGIRCGRLCTVTRKLREIGEVVDRQGIRVYTPRSLHVRYAHYYCARCNRYFSADTTYLSPAKCHYSARVRDAALKMIRERGLSYRRASSQMWERHAVVVPFATIQNWNERQP